MTDAVSGDRGSEHAGERPGTAVGRRHLVLVGLMGSGKSTCGQLLAERLGRPFFDCDAEVEARLGDTIRAFWEANGEPAFRAVETEVVADLLGRSTPSVVATGGGAVLADANRSLLRAPSCLVVWLRADPAVLAERAAGASHRPLLDGGAVAALEAMAQQRSRLYAEVADVVVDVAPHGVEQVVALVLEGCACAA